MKALTRFVDKRFKRLKMLLKQFPLRGAGEELHQIRLEIKKVKALLRLIHYHDHTFRDHKTYIPFRTIFREAGKIRDRGMRKELLEQYTQIHTPFYQSPNRMELKFIQSIPERLKFIDKQEKSICKKIKKIDSTTFNRYLKKKNKDLTKMLSPDFRLKDLHGIRKQIKEITYLTLVITKKNKIDPFLISSANSIGSWHDKKIVIPWIRLHAPQEKETLKRLQHEANSDLQQLKWLIQNR